MSARFVSLPDDSADPPGLKADIGDGRRFLCFLFFVLHAS
jgi:hypothetical protein